MDCPYCGAIDGWRRQSYDGGEAMNYQGNYYYYGCSSCGESDDDGLQTDEYFQYLDSGLEEA